MNEEYLKISSRLNNKMKFNVTSFYKYVSVENPDEITREIREFCNEKNILVLF